jgi:hypothetical protein
LVREGNKHLYAIDIHFALSNYLGRPGRAIVARPNFIELPARDLAASQTFFETVFGMTMTGFGPTYACTLTGDVDILDSRPTNRRRPKPPFP